MEIPGVLVVVVFVAMALVGIVARLIGKRRTPTTAMRYKSVPLFNATEHSFFMALRSIAPPHIAVLAKVRVADIIVPQSNDIPAFNRIARKHVDFVLYNIQNRTVVRAIELDGPTHGSERSRKGDNVKNSSFASARILLTRIDAVTWNQPARLRELFTDDRDQQLARPMQEAAHEPEAAHGIGPRSSISAPIDRRRAKEGRADRS